MARFDVYRSSNGSYLVDCQSDLFSHLTSRFVAPLTPVSDAPPIERRLNPTFIIDGQTLVLRVQYASAIDRSKLGTKVDTLAEQDITVIGAIDRLITGA